MGTVFVKFEEGAQFEVFDVSAVARVEYLSRGETGTIFFRDGNALYSSRINCQLVERALAKAAAGMICSDPTIRPGATP